LEFFKYSLLTLDIIIKKVWLKDVSINT
jgi:hypothetical protein